MSDADSAGFASETALRVVLEPLREVDGDVVPGSEPVGVAVMFASEHGHPCDNAQSLEDVVQIPRVQWIDEPNRVIDDERQARPLHQCVGGLPST